MVNAERIPFRRHGGEALCQMVKYAAHGKERSLPTRQLWNHMHLKMSTVGVEGKNMWNILSGLPAFFREPGMEMKEFLMT